MFVEPHSRGYNTQMQRELQMKPTIELSPNGFLLTIPSMTTGGHHSVEVPATEGGLKIMQKVLRARGAETQKIGQAGSPTQAQVEEWLRAERRERELARIENERVKRETNTKAVEEMMAHIDITELDL